MDQKQTDNYAKILGMPQVPYYWQLTAQMAMLGHNLVSERTLREAADIFNQKFQCDDWWERVEDDRASLPDGLIAVSNHVRSKPHETWQMFDLGEYMGKLCLVANEAWQDEEMVTVTRFFFGGTEEGFLDALKNIT